MSSRGLPFLLLLLMVTPGLHRAGAEPEVEVRERSLCSASRGHVASERSCHGIQVLNGVEAAISLEGSEEDAQLPLYGQHQAAVEEVAQQEQNQPGALTLHSVMPVITQQQQDWLQQPLPDAATQDPAPLVVVQQGSVQPQQPMAAAQEHGAPAAVPAMAQEQEQPQQQAALERPPEPHQEPTAAEEWQQEQQQGLAQQPEQPTAFAATTGGGAAQQALAAAQQQRQGLAQQPEQPTTAIATEGASEQQQQAVSQLHGGLQASPDGQNEDLAAAEAEVVAALEAEANKSPAAAAAQGAPATEMAVDAYESLAQEAAAASQETQAQGPAASVALEVAAAAAAVQHALPQEKEVSLAGAQAAAQETATTHEAAATAAAAAIAQQSLAEEEALLEAAQEAAVGTEEAAAQQALAEEEALLAEAQEAAATREAAAAADAQQALAKEEALLAEAREAGTAQEAGALEEAASITIQEATAQEAAADAQQALAEEEALLAEAERQLMHSEEDRRDVAGGVTILAAMYERLDAKLPPTSTHKARLQRAADSEVFEEGNAATSRSPDVDLKKNPELGPLSKGAFILAALLSTGIGGAVLPYDDTQAVRMLHRAAVAFCPEAQLALADRYLEGRGVPKNVKEGMRRALVASYLLQKELEQKAGMAVHPHPLRLRRQWMDNYYIAPGTIEASHHMVSMEQDLAERGLGRPRDMGFRMLMGHGVPRDEAGAFRLFQEAARQGDVQAHYDLAFMYMGGIHVQRNATKAMHHLKKAADGGWVNAYGGLGMLYYNGDGVERNYTLARYYFEQCAQLNDHACLYNLGGIHQDGLGVPKNQVLANQIFERALHLGNWRASHQLMIVHEKGWGGLPADLGAAAKVFRKYLTFLPRWGEMLNSASKAAAQGDTWHAAVQYAQLAEQGCTEALMNLGWMLHRGVLAAPEELGGAGRGVEGGLAQRLALDMFQRAAKLGDAEAMVVAGHMRYYGGKYGLEGGTNVTAALHLYHQAATLGHAEGMYSLGYMYEHGVAVSQNLTVARRLYKEVVKKATGEHEAMAAWLALLRVRLRVAVGGLRGLTGVLVLQSACRAWAQGLGRVAGAIPGAHAVASAAGRLSRQWGSDRLMQWGNMAVAKAGGWDALAKSALACALTLVLWRKRQVRRRLLESGAQPPVLHPLPAPVPGQAGEQLPPGELLQQAQQQQQRRRPPAQEERQLLQQQLEEQQHAGQQG